MDVYSRSRFSAFGIPLSGIISLFFVPTSSASQLKLNHKLHPKLFNLSDTDFRFRTAIYRVLLQNFKEKGHWKGALRGPWKTTNQVVQFPLTHDYVRELVLKILFCKTCSMYLLTISNIVIILFSFFAWYLSQSNVPLSILHIFTKFTNNYDFFHSYGFCYVYVRQITIIRTDSAMSTLGKQQFQAFR